MKINKHEYIQAIFSKVLNYSRKELLTVVYNYSFFIHYASIKNRLMKNPILKIREINKTKWFSTMPNAGAIELFIKSGYRNLLSGAFNSKGRDAKERFNSIAAQEISSICGGTIFIEEGNLSDSVQGYYLMRIWIN